MKHERDTSCLMVGRDRLIAQLLQVLTDLGWKPPSGDVVDEIANGGLLTVAQAAIICEAADQSVYRWLADAARRGEPLGLKRATWMIGKARLLDYVEKYQGGLPARVKAENLLKKHWPIWSKPQELCRGMNEHEPS
jgi:hypothetical protein